jgi:hypothetical protein
MSAVSILNQGDRVSLVADGGCYDLEGRLQSVGTKIVEIPQIRSAFGLRGVSEYIPWLAARFALVGSFAELLEMVPDSLATARVLSAAAYPEIPAHVHAAKLSLIGWVDGAPAAYTVNTDDMEICGVPYLNVGPTPGGEGADVLALASPDRPIASEADWQACPTDAAALSIITAQRHWWVEDDGPGWDAFGGHVVGGFGEVLTIDANGSSRKRLCTWPDPIGEKIKP